MAYPTVLNVYVKEPETFFEIKLAGWFCEISPVLLDVGPRGKPLSNIISSVIVSVGEKNRHAFIFDALAPDEGATFGGPIQKDNRDRPFPVKKGETMANILQKFFPNAVIHPPSFPHSIEYKEPIQW